MTPTRIALSWAIGYGITGLVALFFFIALKMLDRRCRSERFPIKTPNGNFSTFAAFIRYHRAEGYRVGKLVCFECNHRALAFFPPDKMNIPACRRCGAETTFQEADIGAC